MSPPRHAVYFTPDPASALWRTASRIIGRDAVADRADPFPPEPPCDAPDWADLTADPRRYGFHATLKAPFELAAGTDPAGLLEAAATFARDREAFAVDLRVDLLGDFVALRPAAPSPALDRLAADCVVLFEPFRAPLDPAERRRRLGPDPSPSRIETVDRWGYAHVFEQFRFHMTLTGALPDDRREPIRRALARTLDPLAAATPIDAITIFEQTDRAGPFRVLGRFPFGRTSALNAR